VIQVYPQAMSYDAVCSLGLILILYFVQSYWNQLSIGATDVVGLLNLRKEHEQQNRFGDHDEEELREKKCL
jgi:hypothetical protein